MMRRDIPEEGLGGLTPIEARAMMRRLWSYDDNDQKGARWVREVGRQRNVEGDELWSDHIGHVREFIVKAPVQPEASNLPTLDM